jgi:uncharacterized membrane protein HdeD (DUF308 family)
VAHGILDGCGKCWQFVAICCERLDKADSIMGKVSLVCTLGTAFIGIANAIVTFSDNPLAQKVLSISVAVFGVILSLLKGSLFAPCCSSHTLPSAFRC